MSRVRATHLEEYRIYELLSTTIIEAYVIIGYVCLKMKQSTRMLVVVCVENMGALFFFIIAVSRVDTLRRHRASYAFSTILILIGETLMVSNTIVNEVDGELLLGGEPERRGVSGEDEGRKHEFEEAEEGDGGKAVRSRSGDPGFGDVSV